MEAVCNTPTAHHEGDQKATERNDEREERSRVVERTPLPEQVQHPVHCRGERIPRVTRGETSPGIDDFAGALVLADAVVDGLAVGEEGGTEPSEEGPHVRVDESSENEGLDESEDEVVVIVPASVPQLKKVRNL